MRLFFDTSAFVKRYVEEAGSDRVLELCGLAETIGLSVICLPELISTLCRLVREGHITDADYGSLKAAILVDLKDADVCELTAPILGHTLGCLERNALRAMDAIHIASALAYRPDFFVSADQRQIDAARSEGLIIEKISN